MKKTYEIRGHAAMDAIEEHYEREGGYPCEEFHAWKSGGKVDPMLGARYIHSLEDAKAVLKEDPALLVVYIVNPEEARVPKIKEVAE